MSEASRSTALAHAIAYHDSKTPVEYVLATAEQFHLFMQGESTPLAAKAAKPAPAAAKPAPKAAKPAPEPEPAEEAADEGAVTKEEIGEVVKQMLGANLKAEALALFKKHGGSSLSSLPAKNYAAFKEDAETALMAS